MTKRVRRLRHWKQRFDPNAAFVWRTAKLWEGKMTKPGQRLSADYTNDPRNRAKVKRLWESGMIELAEFDAVVNTLTGERESQAGKKAKPEKAIKSGKKWVAANDLDGEEFKTKKAAVAFYDELASLAERALDGELDGAVTAVQTLIEISQIDFEETDTETDEETDEEPDTETDEEPDFLN